MISKLAKYGLGLGLLWYGVLRGAKGLVIKLDSYTFRSINTDGTVSLNLNLRVKNPLLVGITIKGISGDVYAQGHQVGTINTTYDYYLAGGKTHILPVVVNLALGDVLTAAQLNIASGDIRNLTVSFDGKVYVGQRTIGLPLQFELDYDYLTSDK